MRFLFIGGPADGQRINIESTYPGPIEIPNMLNFSLRGLLKNNKNYNTETVLYDRYYLYGTLIYKVHDLTDGQVIKLLVEGYHER